MPVGHPSEEDEQGSGQINWELRLRCHDQSGRKKTKSCIMDTKGGDYLRERVLLNAAVRAKKMKTEKCPFNWEAWPLLKALIRAV